MDCWMTRHIHDDHGCICDLTGPHDVHHCSVCGDNPDSVWTVTA